MKLFLCSSFITQDTRPDFEKLIARPMKGLNIACITTASQGYMKLCKARNEEPDLTWLTNDLKKAREEFECSVDTFDIETLSKAYLSTTLINYDALWMEGGMTFYLMEAIYSTEFDQVLTKLLETKVYIGTSAGSMICSTSLDASEWYVGEPEANHKGLSGLGLIPFQIYPHFDERDLAKITELRHKDQEYWLLKDGQAVCVSGGEIYVSGGNAVILHSNPADES